MNRTKHARLAFAPRYASWLAVLLLPVCAAACTTLASLANIGASVFFSTADTALSGVLLPQTIFASAGEEAFVAVNEMHILDASASGILGGAGFVNTSPPVPLTFAWEVANGPLTDLNGDGLFGADDLAAAGVTLNFADTANAQFASPAAGEFVLIVTVSGVDRYGAAITGGDNVTVNVFSITP